MPNHHAVVFITDSLAAVALVPEALRSPSMDVVHTVTDRLSIDMVRDLVADALVRPVSSEFRTHVIVARDVPREAQNALLKLFEEPPQAARFILVIPRADMLLPTLRSRVYLVGQTEGLQTSPEFTAFMASSYAKRMELAASWAKEKDMETMEQVLRGAEAYAHAHVAKAPACMATVLFVRDYFALVGSARKMLLEELALVLPRG